MNLRSRKIGTFMIPDELFEDHSLEELTSQLKFFPIRSEYRFDMKCFEITAISPFFNYCPPGQMAGNYRVVIEKLANEEDDEYGFHYYFQKDMGNTIPVMLETASLAEQINNEKIKYLSENKKPIEIRMTKWCFNHLVHQAKDSLCYSSVQEWSSLYGLPIVIDNTIQEDFKIINQKKEK
jgi:hypothetical protein